MTIELPEWAETAASFLSQNLPKAQQGPGWQDMASTAYQIGCIGLVRLGFAESTPWGARAKEPAPPSVLPRWDDIATSVLWLAVQQGLISFRLPDGSLPPVHTRIPNVGLVTFSVSGAPPPPPPNIQPKHGLGPAYCRPGTLDVLKKTGLVAENEWAKAAEFILWRTSPRVWALDFRTDIRFVSAAQHAATSLPSDVESEIERLVHITDRHVDELISKQASANREAREKHGPKVLTGAAPSRESARKSLEFSRAREIDWLFFRRWRIDSGWLSEGEAATTISIFHDRLAIAMRKAVIQRLHPMQGAFV